MTTRELFARLIRCEAEGEGEDGMRAVATVCMNRVRVAYGEYQRVCEGDLRRVIEQYCQFSCCKSVIYGERNDQNVWSMTPLPEHYRVADWALSGNVHTGAGGDALWYMNPFSDTCPDPFPRNGSGYWYTRINQHCFYNPTNSYAQT
ncbi:MAG: cell wall hydrolase [Oscillospiraceae bacterium]|jgi:N-acetylmuramoyl-L-alanine amidase|nr:cell wall hydrolase [Oscillospiraceae bacterium]